MGGGVFRGSEKSVLLLASLSTLTRPNILPDLVRGHIIARTDTFKYLAV